MTTAAENTLRLEHKLRSFFGLKCLPFSKDIDPDRLFRTDAFDRALERLRYLADRQGIGAVFGAPGTGKSTLLRTFLSSLGKTTHALAYVEHTTCAVVDLYREIAVKLQLQPRHRKADLLRDIKERIAKLARVQKLRVVLILDDAHLLPSTFLEELRILTSFDADSRDDLTVILAGHPQLETNLRLAVNEALAQRVIIRARLRSLHPEEVAAYLALRLQLAGRTAKLFLPDACEALARAARGIPRLIDRIGEHALLLALASSRKEIDAELINAAVDEVDP